MKTANLFIEDLNLTKNPYIAIYARIEKLLKKNGTLYINENYQKCCVSVLQKVLFNVKKRYKLADVLLITDMGKYGSDSCTTGDCKVASDNLLKHIEKAIKIKMFDYDPNKTPQKIDNGGFAAMVEMEILARSKRLITVGSGLFKEQVTQLYERGRVHINNVYAICKEMDVNLLYELNDIAPSHC